MSLVGRRRFELVALVVAVAFCGLHVATHAPVVLGAGVPSGVQRVVQLVEGRLWDLRFRLRGQRAPNPAVAVVAIDE
ncbi:MAG: hypothetical protein INH37_19900, partial [Myxococcaceae bacterium]|nr:hypothetical protein [Myxococcaceae bacterium]